MKLFLINWLNAWIDMICGMISVLTFTLYRPWWDFKFRSWIGKKVTKRMIRRNSGFYYIRERKPDK